jgi:nucleoside 2-deoxyribosyltransferase
MLAYLCGPIEFAADGGKMWRRKLTPFLTQQLGHRVYDPAEDERKSLTEEEAANFREWKTTDVDRFRRVLRKIIHFDLDLIENRADYVICHLGDSAAAGVTSGGTAAELTFAYRKSIPVYMVTTLKPEQLFCFNVTTRNGKRSSGRNRVAEWSQAPLRMVRSSDIKRFNAQGF